MLRRTVPLVVTVSMVLAAAAVSTAAPSASPAALEMYTTIVDRATAQRIVEGGYDVADLRDVRGGVRVDLVLRPSQRAKLAAQGIPLRLWRGRGGLTASELARAEGEDGFEVWRSWDERGGIRDELYRIAREHRNIVKLEVIGSTHQGREIIALKVTKNARRRADGSRPAVLYIAAQHAREWISVEVNRRLLRHLVDNYGKDDTVTSLVDSRELWFVLVANPDGYEYTFDRERLWRKNLRDNDGDGKITTLDGVDLNRNFDAHWGYDDEGSSSLPSSDTYRGPAPSSEPETQAMAGLIDAVGFEFMVNFHSFGEWLLYPEGFQVDTLTPDNPIFLALSGTDVEPAIPGFDPGLSATELYVTNGDTNDYAYSRGTLAWVPELGEGEPGSGFVFPDDEQLVQAEFEKTLRFSLDVARSAPDPANPTSHLGNETEPFYLDQTYIDRELANNPLADVRFRTSHGSPQTVQVLARRGLGDVTLRYSINRGPVQSAPTEVWDTGERYGGAGIYYHYLRGQVEGTEPGDQVRVWFEADGERSPAFRFEVERLAGSPVLILSAEDYTGTSPDYPKQEGPLFLRSYRNALRANGLGADVYDVDAHGRRAPDDLGVLSHYDTVIWYTGNDIVTRDIGMAPGTASRLAHDEITNIREYLNEGGNVFYTGKYAGFQYAFGYEYDPVSNLPCDAEDPTDRCLGLSNDYMQYWFGAWAYNFGAGLGEKGPFDVDGTDQPFDGLSWEFGAPSAENQDHAASFLATSGLLPPDRFPLFTSVASSRYDRPGGPFDPHTGQYYVFSQTGDESYKRLSRTIDLTGESSGSLSFWVSRDTEEAWDFVFVEAHTVGDDDWTTLPDLNGHTSTEVGDSCPSGWIDEIHPFLAHYQTPTEEGCDPRGTSGEWHAASGSSHGWEQWSVDLSPFAGEEVEVSISYATDWATLGLGVFVDDIEVSTGEGTTSFEKDGNPMDGWTAANPPEGSPPLQSNWTRTTSEGFPEGATITTEGTILAGFGVEGVAGASDRAAIVGRAMEHLLGA